MLFRRCESQSGLEYSGLRSCTPSLDIPSRSLSCVAGGPADVCRIIDDAEFRQGYRETYLNTTEPAEAIDDLRDNMQAAEQRLIWGLIRRSRHGWRCRRSG